MTQGKGKCSACEQPWTDGHRCPGTDAARAVTDARCLVRFAELVRAGIPPTEAGPMAMSEIDA